MSAISDIAYASIVFVADDTCAVADEEDVCPYTRVTEGVQSLQEIQHLNVVAAAADITVLVFDDKKGAQVEERPMLDRAFGMRLCETRVQLHLEVVHDSNAIY